MSGWECLPTGLCGPCCFTGEWLLDVGCGNTLDPSRKSVKKSQLCRNKRQNADYFSKRFQI
ncbi:hypothetical protein GE284_17970 [Shigella flexneri]|nr:hypothetical protein [Escherichia coli]EFV8633090.1 hypothetical protein [Shigella flexneri]EFV8984802.1 hypothetical protein [Shigella sonnei]EFF9740804.1 hypothetical protein [Escherichia coli]EFV8637219.1 hypothetical protein [Shigella flexneri]